MHAMKFFGRLREVSRGDLKEVQNESQLNKIIKWSGQLNGSIIPLLHTMEGMCPQKGHELVASSLKRLKYIGYWWIFIGNPWTLWKNWRTPWKNSKTGYHIFFDNHYKHITTDWEQIIWELTCWLEKSRNLKIGWPPHGPHTRSHACVYGRSAFAWWMARSFIKRLLFGLNDCTSSRMLSLRLEIGDSVVFEGSNAKSCEFINYMN